ncbi:MAG: helix-turn-helix transcriptional regulator [Eubacteriales bacterium]|nr:helix-turn-helix transcriptional regulator [Eubacteriales bacterium]
MRHIILFCYMVTILIGVSAITIQWLANKRKSNASDGTMRHFVFLLLFMNVYDLLIYYNDYILKTLDNITMIRIGDCIIAAIVYMWLKVQRKVVQSEKFDGLIKLMRIFVICYLSIWFLTMVFLDYNNIIKVTYICMDIALVLLLVVGGAAFIVYNVKEKLPKSQIYYMSIVTIMMTLNYITYFGSEIGVTLGDSEYVSGPMDFTIFYWFIINIANMMVIYNKYFKVAYAESEQSESAENAFNLDVALDEMKNKYDLTAREIELAREIYEGKSNIEIAKDLFISESTVKTHIYNIFRKIGVKNRVEVVCVIRGEKKEMDN